MFGFGWKNKYYELLKQKIETEEGLRKEIMDLQATVAPFDGSCSVSIDFNTMKPFSIERIPGNPSVREKTSVGYFLNDNVREWCLYISREQHEDLVKQFNEWKSYR